MSVEVVPGSQRPLPEDVLLLKALDNLSAMVAYWDADQRCRFANRAYERWFGVSPEALIGKHISELLGPIYALNLPYIEGALRGERQEFERDIPDPAGGPLRHSLANYIPDIADGVVRGFFVLVTDVSGIKRAQLALRDAEERLRLIIQEAPIGMALVSMEGRFLQVNRALCDIIGYPAEELLQTSVQTVTHPQDLDTDLAQAARLVRGEIPRYMLEKRYIRKDGGVVDIELSASLLRGPQGQPLHFIAQIEDIGDRKRRETEQRFLAELGPVLASTLDAERIVERVEELVTRRMADFCIVDLVVDHMVRKLVTSRDPAKRPAARALGDLPLDFDRPYLLAEAVRTQRAVLVQRPTDEELAAMTQSPEHLRIVKAFDMVSMIAVPLVASERVVGAIGLIAARGSREYDARDLQLAQELAWRTAIALENARLYHTAREATKARDDILAIVAHDLRNPLSTIAMQAALLRRRSQLRAGHEAAVGDIIQRAAGRMTRLIEDLLDISRMEAGRLSIDPAPVEAGAFVAECVQAQSHLAEEAAIELLLEAAPDLPQVWADRDRLSQVFENLIGNALKFTPRGGRITVGAQAGEGEVAFRVCDTGAGIPPGHLPHLFDRFWQARRAERQGAGLGLPIVKGVVEAHGGRVWVESTPGEGSCFFFTMPRFTPQPA